MITPYEPGIVLDHDGVRGVLGKFSNAGTLSPTKPYTHISDLYRFGAGPNYTLIAVEFTVYVTNETHTPAYTLGVRWGT